MKRRTHRRPLKNELCENGQDSFLDIISNVVGILIILVMIAGAQVRAFHPQRDSESALAVADSAAKLDANPDADSATIPEVDTNLANDPAAVDSAVADPAADSAANPAANPAVDSAVDIQTKREYVQTAQKFEEAKDKINKIKQDVEDQNAQVLLTQQEANGADLEYQNLMREITQLEAAIELESREKETSEKVLFDLNREDQQLTEQKKTLERVRDSLIQAKPKATVLENIPTPLSKKVEGHEGYFCLKRGRISHIPLNVFVERVRSTFENYRDLEGKEIEKTLGPVEQYSFRFHASVRDQKTQNSVVRNIEFDFGQCLPQNDQIGETFDVAVSTDSLFHQKLSLYLKETSTITLFVYPDSFELLRDVKRYLIEHGYTLAIRPLPMDQLVTISPHGSDSMTY